MIGQAHLMQLLFTCAISIKLSGADPGFLERVFLCIRVWGLVLLILSHFFLNILVRPNYFIFMGPRPNYFIFMGLPNYFIFMGFLKTGGREGGSPQANPIWIRH